MVCNINLKTIIFLLFCFRISKSENICGYSSENIININNNNDLNQLINCTTVNASIHINGQNILTSINKLQSIRHITGYLSIIHSPALSNISSLSNLISIDGENLYFDEYSVFISDNRELNNKTNGLCWTDNINWYEFINNDTNVYINNNALNCSSCFEQCNNCWIGNDPKNCQKCKNFISGNNCVEYCSIGTNILYNESICNETIVPDIETLNTKLISNNEIIVSWNAPYKPNGVILEYQLVETTINYSKIVYTYKTVYNSSGYDSKTSWFYHKKDTNPFTTYNYTLFVKNSIGYGKSNISSIKTYPKSPPKPNKIDIVYQTLSEMGIIIYIPQFNSPFIDYIFEWDENNASISNINNVSSNYRYYIIHEIQHDINYKLNIKTLTINSIESDEPYIFEFTLPYNTIINSNSSDCSNEIILNFGFNININVNIYINDIYNNYNKNYSINTNGIIIFDELISSTEYNLTLSWNGFDKIEYFRTFFNTSSKIPIIIESPNIISETIKNDNISLITFNSPLFDNLNNYMDIYLIQYYNLNIINEYLLNMNMKNFTIEINTFNISSLEFTIKSNNTNCIGESNFTLWNKLNTNMSTTPIPPLNNNDEIYEKVWFWIIISCSFIIPFFILLFIYYYNRYENEYNKRAISPANIYNNEESKNSPRIHNNLNYDSSEDIFNISNKQNHYDKLQHNNSNNNNNNNNTVYDYLHHHTS